MESLLDRCRRGVARLLGCAATASPNLYLLAVLLAATPFLQGAAEPIAGSLSPIIRWLLIGVMGLIIALSLNAAPSVGLVLVLLYVSLMGGIRRGLIPFLGYESNDPMTIVSASISMGMMLRFFQRGQVRRDTPISRLMVPLMGVMLVEVFNPLQGGLLVGISGAIFFLGPISWYFVGRNLGNRRILMVLTNTIILIAVLAGVYGMLQTYNGFLPEEIQWIKQSGYRQLLSGGRYRVFSFYLSFGEYVAYVAMGAILSWVQILQRRYFFVSPFVFLLMVLFLSSSRGGVVGTLLGIGVVWAVQGRDWRGWLPRLALAAVLGVYGLTLGLKEAQQATFDKEVAGFASHTIEGLSDPFGKNSTGESHVALFGGGIMAGLRNPVGRGLGVTTNAVRKFGEGTNVSTELDISNMFLTCGVLGGGLYIALMVAIGLTVGRYWHGTRDPVGLCVIGILAVSVGNWLTGAYYSLTVTVWVCLGILDGMMLKWLASQPKPAARPSVGLQRRRTPATSSPEPQPASG